MRKILFSIGMLQGIVFSFGQNKIQYKDFKWEILESPHFRIYFYEGEEPLASFGISVLEKTYTRLSTLFSLNLEEKIPVIIYNSPNDFRQTNVILELLEEGVGGFTEIYKNRVVVPFDGSYASFRHVLEHELTHVFEFKLYYRGIQGLAESSFFQIPLYIMEGLPEYISLEWDSETEGFVKDLLLNDFFPTLQELENYGGFIVYKAGQSFFYFIKEVYGEKKVSEFLYQLKYRKSMEGASLKTFGITVEELSNRFSYFLKKKVYRNLEDFDYPENISRRLTNHRKTGGFLNVGANLSEKGDMVAFLSDRTGYTDLYLLSITGEREAKKIISGERVPSLENLHLLRPGITFAFSDSLIILTSSGGDKDVLNFYSVQQKKIIRMDKLSFDAIYTPIPVPNNYSLILVGVKNSATNLYQYYIDTKEVYPITDDWFDERDPVFSRDGKYLFYISDKNDEGNYGSYAVFQMDWETKETRRITPYLGFIKNPYPIDDSLVSFLYEGEGIQNLYVYNMKQNSLYRVTNFPTTVREISYSADGKNSVAVLLWEGGYDLFFINGIFDKKDRWVKVSFEEIEGRKRQEFEEKEWREYFSGFSLDWIAGGAMYAPAYGYYGSLALSASDALGNLRIAFYTDMNGGDLLNSNWEFDLFYLPKRIDLLFSFYQFFPLLPYAQDEWAVERNLGFSNLLLMPFNRFFRLELGYGFEYNERYIYVYDYELGGMFFSKPDYFLNTPVYVGSVLDRTSYFYPGVKDGERFKLAFEQGVWPRTVYTKGFIDTRKYFRITPRSNFAIRGVLGGKVGSERALPFWLGGPTTLRGYDLFEKVGNYMGMFNMELRLPFLERLKLSFPIPLELGGIRLNLFMDAGTVLQDINSIKKFHPFEKTDGFFKLDQLLLNLGFGLRWNLGFFLLKFDVARKTDLTDFKGNTFYWITFGDDF